LKGLAGEELDAPYLNTRSKKKTHKKPQAAEAQPELGWLNTPETTDAQMPPGYEDLT